MSQRRVPMQRVKWSYQHRKLTHAGVETTLESKRLFESPSECLRAWDSAVSAVEKRLICKGHSHSWHDHNVWESLSGINASTGLMEAHIWRAVAVVEVDDD